MTHLLSGFALVESGPALTNAVSPVSNHKTQIKSGDATTWSPTPSW